MNSEIPINEECDVEYAKLKMHKTVKYIIFKVSPVQTEVVVDSKSSSSDYQEFLDQFPEKQCRWAIYDFDYELDDGSKRTKIIFFSWCPDEADGRQKMVTTTSMAALLDKFRGSLHMQCNEISDLAYDADSTVSVNSASKGQTGLKLIWTAPPS
ncbi:hypothetical protein C0991_012421 [Blastosporella zonata]|nr:hypothetical protein C0991_012421 [Blastosporella zonata]